MCSLSLRTLHAVSLRLVLLSLTRKIPNYSGFALMIAGCVRHNLSKLSSALTCTAIPNS